MTIQIRRMTVDDLETVEAVARKTWAATYADIIPEAVQQEFLDRSYAAAALQHRMEQGLFLVADADGALIGFANFFPLPGLAVELAAIYVLPEAQGQGVGSQLIKTGLAAYPEATRLRVLVERANVIGRRFYEARGFQPVREYVEHLFGHDFNVVELTLPLAGTAER